MSSAELHIINANMFGKICLSALKPGCPEVEREFSEGSRDSLDLPAEPLSCKKQCETMLEAWGSRLPPSNMSFTYQVPWHRGKCSSSPPPLLGAGRPDRSHLPRKRKQGTGRLGASRIGHLSMFQLGPYRPFQRPRAGGLASSLSKPKIAASGAICRIT